VKKKKKVPLHDFPSPSSPGSKKKYWYKILLNTVVWGKKFSKKKKKKKRRTPNLNGQYSTEVNFPSPFEAEAQKSWGLACLFKSPSGTAGGRWAGGGGGGGGMRVDHLAEVVEMNDVFHFSIYHKWG
jgi:hypothetical protein